MCVSALHRLTFVKKGVNENKHKHVHKLCCYTSLTPLRVVDSEEELVGTEIIERWVKGGGGWSHFNVSIIVGSKSQGSLSKQTTFEENELRLKPQTLKICLFFYVCGPKSGQSNRSLDQCLHTSLEPNRSTKPVHMQGEGGGQWKLLHTITFMRDHSSSPPNLRSHDCCSYRECKSV